MLRIISYQDAGDKPENMASPVSYSEINPIPERQRAEKFQSRVHETLASKSPRALDENTDSWASPQTYRVGTERWNLRTGTGMHPRPPWSLKSGTPFNGSGGIREVGEEGKLPVLARCPYAFVSCHMSHGVVPSSLRFPSQD